jgi:thymidylate synthase (FAD)
MMNNAKIIAITNPLVDGVKSADEFIAYTARVSNPSNQMNTDTSEKLLKYCIRNKHFSIFEMINVVMEVNTSRDIARQILRHRSFSFQ